MSVEVKSQIDESNLEIFSGNIGTALDTTDTDTRAVEGRQGIGREVLVGEELPLNWLAVRIGQKTSEMMADRVLAESYMHALAHTRLMALTESSSHQRVVAARTVAFGAACSHRPKVANLARGCVHRTRTPELTRCTPHAAALVPLPVCS